MCPQTITVSGCCLIKLLPYILFEKCITNLAVEMASPGNQHCDSSIGTLSFHNPHTPLTGGKITNMSLHALHTLGQSWRCIIGDQMLSLNPETVWKDSKAAALPPHLWVVTLRRVHHWVHSETCCLLRTSLQTLILWCLLLTQSNAFQLGQSPNCPFLWGYRPGCHLINSSLGPQRPKPKWHLSRFMVVSHSDRPLYIFLIKRNIMCTVSQKVTNYIFTQWFFMEDTAFLYYLHGR